MDGKEIKKFEGKKVAIKTKAGSFFKTSNLLFCETYVVFNDKYGMRVVLDISQISSIQELPDNQEVT